MRLARFLVATTLLVGVAAECTYYEPCDEYVDYICDCHADDTRPGYDCQTLRITYQNADPELQDECAVALDDQIEEDDQDGYACDSDTGL